MDEQQGADRDEREDDGGGRAVAVELRVMDVEMEAALRTWQQLARANQAEIEWLRQQYVELVDHSEAEARRRGACRVNDFETVREDDIEAVRWFLKGHPHGLAALDRIEAEVERLREALEEIAKWPVRKPGFNRENEEMYLVRETARDALAEEKE
jgi:hypothetical protein